ncbi:hypothetical protein PR002_g31499, partial [Phytophthora rubi]
RQCTAVWISFLAGGLIVGSLVDSIYNAGIFLIGAAVGVFLATIRQRVLRLPHLPERPEHGTPQAIALGLVCGLVAFMIERPAIIAATALVDSVVLINGDLSGRSCYPPRHATRSRDSRLPYLC